MPTEAEIEALNDSLLLTTAEIATSANLALNANAEMQEQESAMDLREAQLLSAIANDRVTYQNAEARKAAIIEQCALDAVFQAARDAAVAAELAKRQAEIQTETGRKTFRANELLLLYYANNPTP